MKIYSNKNVYEAAKERIARLFDEFDKVTVSSSGGKDSTVVLNLALEVAEEKNKLPLTVIYIDQEAEWNEVSEYVETYYDDPRIDFMWFQIPLQMSNNTSNQNEYVQCWKKGDEWLRPKHPRSIHENVYGVDRFYGLFTAILGYHWTNETVANISGMRAQESPQRLHGLTAVATYKDITWGKIQNKSKGHYNFHPIYDWEISDVWLYIQSNRFNYCKIYDKLYNLGVKIKDMRVSNLHHETAIQNLWLVQEIDGDLWSKLVSRIDGVNSSDKLKTDGFGMPKKLPHMFRSWKEYRDYLTEKLITNEESRGKIKKRFDKQDVLYKGMQTIDNLYRVQVKEIIRNDIEGTLSTHFQLSPDVRQWFKWKRDPHSFAVPEGYKNKYIGIGYA